MGSWRWPSRIRPTRIRPADPLADADWVAAPLADALPDPEALPEPPHSPKLRTSAPSSSPQAAPMVASASDSAVAVMMR